MKVIVLRFVDYKCKDCESITEIVIRGEDGCQIKCEKCGSKNMIRVFSPVGFKSSYGGNDNSGSSSSCSSCTSRSCATCSSGNL
ncbi:MAG: zinc ribbon domain-containing protein [Actinobacteria bacterium]|nr:zinc ribbon domain-containing protein [Clostridia bacterium]TET13763.1 MAG: zinc ribbon domain-containing protein [Actinomycetota bacterium]